MSNWGHIHLPKEYIKPDPNHKWCWCIGTEFGTCIVGPGVVTSSVEDTPEFERSIRLKFTDITLGDLIHVNESGKTSLARYLKEKLGFTFVWEHWCRVEAWKDDVCYYSAVSEKCEKFLEQVEEYAAVYLHPSTNLDYEKLPPVNTLNEKLSFFKNIIHRGRYCTCRIT